MNKVLIIGGCGYIGTYLSEFLSSRDCQIETLDLEWFGKFHDFHNTKADYAQVQPSFFEPFDTIILLAGHSSVKMCAGNLRGTFDNNVRNFVYLLPKLGNKKFIYASSSSIYGNINRSLMEEGCPEYVLGNYYDFSKHEIDGYAQLNSGVEYYGLRFGTVNGPSKNFRTDIMINAMYASAITQKRIKINNPNIRRPILGINDLSRAIFAIISGGDASKSGIYNLASLNSTVELIGRHVSDHMNVPLEFLHDSPNVYDFAISTKKFEEAFEFSFADSIKSIIKDIELKSKTLNHTHRNNIIAYA